MMWALFFVAALAAYFDLKSRKIPNWLTYSTYLFSLLWIKNHLGFFLVTLLIATVIALILGQYIGAGDIKLSLVIANWSQILQLNQYWLYFALTLSGIAGLFYRRKRMPFAPFIAAGVLISNMARTLGFI